ncbi:MAG TPA: SAM-dependent methyltransferase [Pyrinomonadaceae bacterium]
MSEAEQRSGATLAARLRERIRLEGAITFRDWMQFALYDESEGYYCRRDNAIWGRAGDYRTSPERSPLFAATFAGYFAKLYEELDAPAAWTILEAGAGAGHFARGVLQTLESQYPQVFNATRYLIDEVNLKGRERLRQFLNPFKDKIDFVSLDEIEEPLDAGIIFSNELLDAMPVHRVRLRDGRLFELCVGLDEADEYVWIEAEPTTQLLETYFTDLQVRLVEGQRAEVNLAAGVWLCRAARALQSGYVITVDYGAEASELFNPHARPEGSLRAFAQHRFAGNVLAHPGEQDITTTIDWTHLKRAGESCRLETLSFERQDKFLLRAGLPEHLERMTGTAHAGADALMLSTGAREMILPGGMSESFQVLVQKRLTA